MAVLELSVVDTYGKDDNKKSTWHNVIVFGKVAENCAATVSRLDNVIVVGRLEQDEYTKKDGTKGKSVRLIADEIGVSCRWNAWVRDRSEEVVASISAGIGKQMPKAFTEDEEPF
jgi:single-stranded DNA-binding protein